MKHIIFYHSKEGFYACVGELVDDKLTIIPETVEYEKYLSDEEMSLIDISKELGSQIVKILEKRKN